MCSLENVIVLSASGHFSSMVEVVFMMAFVIDDGSPKSLTGIFDDAANEIEALISLWIFS